MEDITEEILNDEGQTSYDKGKELENQFAVFMKHELGWDKIRVGAHMAGKENVKGAAIDIIGIRQSKRGRRYDKAAIIYLIISGALLGIALVRANTIMSEYVTLTTCLLISGVVFAYLSNKFNKEHAWVECKNIKTPININHIVKTEREIKDYKASNNSQYNFEIHYFVSASRYIENAIKYANDKGIICYLKDGNTFKKIEYWN